MNMEALRLVTAHNYIPIYKFNKQKYENGLDPMWVTLWSTVDEIPVKAYSPLRTLEKHHTLEVKIIDRVAIGKNYSSRTRMRERVLVRA